MTLSELEDFQDMEIFHKIIYYKQHLYIITFQGPKKSLLTCILHDIPIKVNDLLCQIAHVAIQCLRQLISTIFGAHAKLLTKGSKALMEKSTNSQYKCNAFTFRLTTDNK